MHWTPLRSYRLSPGRVSCDLDGLKIGAVALLQRNRHGRWEARAPGEINVALAKIYGVGVDIGAKSRGLATVAEALNAGELARARIATLFLHLPEPPTVGAGPASLWADLADSGLLKADADWDAKHPRTGTAPNPGWFAPGSGGAENPEAPNPDGTAHLNSGLSFASVTEAPLLSETLPPAALEGLTTLALRAAGPAAVFGVLFVPRANAVAENDLVPGRSDLSYGWAHDETQVRFRVLIDGQWRTLTQGTRGADNLVRDDHGATIARVVSGPDKREALVADLGALDAAAGAMRAAEGAPSIASTSDTHEPKLCPDATREPKTTTSQNSIRYQEYVSKLPNGLAIKVGGVRFDGCDLKTGILLEAKANINFMFDGNHILYGWVNPGNDPAIQMKSQSIAAQLAGRLVVWHAQTEKGYLALSKIAKELNLANLSVVFDPN